MSAEAALPETVLAGIAQLAHEHLGWRGPVRRDMLLVEELELDSLRLFTLAAEIENHFRINLYEDEEGELHTVGDLVDLIRSKLGRA